MRRSPSRNNPRPTRRLSVLRLEDRTAPTVVPVGGEFQVNTYTTSTQAGPSAAMDQAGNFVVAWTSGDGSGFSISAQRYNSAGLPEGGEFRVNSYTTNSQRFQSIAMDQAGDFVIAWQSDGQDGSGYGVYAKHYSAAGVELSPPAGVPLGLGNEFRVNTYTTQDQFHPSVAMDQAGDFVVAWCGAGSSDNGGTYAHRYNSIGLPQGGEFRVNTYTTNGQGPPSVAMDQSGDFVVAWTGAGLGDDVGVYAQRFGSGGLPQGGEFRVNTYTTNNQYEPSVAMDQAGDFVVTWPGEGQSYNGLYAQRYNSAGLRQGGQFRVNSNDGWPDDLQSVAMDQGGDFVVTWGGPNQVGIDFSVHGRVFFAGGAPDGGEFQVNTTSIEPSVVPFTSTAMDLAGDFVVAWDSISDGDSSGIYAQRYELNTLPRVRSTQIDDGAAQRSRVTSVAVTFSAQVSFATTPAAAFTLTRNADGAAVGFTATAGVIGGVTVVTLNSFTGNETQFGSLKDGRYTLTALASQISANGQQMASNYTFGDAQGLYRFYGDMNGDRRVDISDFGFFSLAFLQAPNYNAALDFNADGRIDIPDFGQFSVRFFTMLP